MLTTASPNFFHNLQSGAPTLNGLAGSLISVLDDCLVNGWGSQTATISVASEVATLTTPLAHVFELHQIALVAGATPSELNGRKRVISRTSNSITFAAPGVADGAATGSITVRLAPAGWSKVFSGTNLAVYRAPATADGTRLYLRVDDTVGRNARVVGYESMTDVDTGEGPFPSVAQISGGGWWPKSTAGDGTSRAWTVIADDRTVYIHTSTSSGAVGLSGCVWGFGDFASYKMGDPFASFLAADNADIANQQSYRPAALESVGLFNSTFAAYIPKSFTGIGGAVVAQRMAESYFNGSTSPGASGSGGFGSISQYPNGPNNGLLLSRIAIAETQQLRGVMRGLYVAPQNCHAAFNRLDVVTGSGDMGGRNLLAVKCGSPLSSLSQGVVFFDITGPW